jgi:catechol 2,3-dioxygenase-like lactoylglutathione lyase family enzyme
MQVVRDLPRANSFYVDLLGFSTLASGRFRAPPGSPNNFGIPAPAADRAALDYMILAPATTGSTQIEVVSFVGVDSRPRRVRDLEAVGLVAPRFPVRSQATPMKT